MCSSSAPKPEPLAPEAPTAPSATNASDAKARERRRASNGGTILTSSSGVVAPAPTSQKTLLGA